MTPRATAAAAFFALLALASTTPAQDPTAPATPPAPAARFGRRSRVLLSVENVLGGFSDSIAQASGDQSSNSLNSNGFFAGFSGPRYGVHAFVYKNLTVGTGLGLWWLKDTTNRAQPSTARVVRLAPRIGWTPTFGPLFSFWFRAGVTYLSFEPAGLQFFDVSAEAFLVYAPLPHFGAIVGPNFDVPISGKSPGSSDLRFQSIGVAVGLFADF